MSIPPSLLSLNGNSEVVRDHEMRRAMEANVVDKIENENGRDAQTRFVGAPGRGVEENRN